MELSKGVAVYRCPLALFREAGDYGYHTWTPMAVSAWESGNFPSYAGSSQLSSIGEDVLAIGLGATRERERREWEASKDKQERERKARELASRQPGVNAARPRPPRPREVGRKCQR